VFFVMDHNKFCVAWTLLCCRWRAWDGEKFSNCQCVGVGSSFWKRFTMVVCIKKHERIKDGVDSIVCGKFERWCWEFCDLSIMILYPNNKKLFLSSATIVMVLAMLFYICWAFEGLCIHLPWCYN
jgi:hypothetical protein